MGCDSSHVMVGTRCVSKIRGCDRHHIDGITCIHCRENFNLNDSGELCLYREKNIINNSFGNISRFKLLEFITFICLIIIL